MKKLLSYFAIFLMAANGSSQTTAEEYYISGFRKSNYSWIKGFNINDAISDFTMAIELSPKYVYAYYYRGWAKEKLGDYSGAIADYTKAIELDTTTKHQYSDCSAYIHRGDLKKKLGDNAGAQEDYQKALIKFDSDTIVNHIYRGDLNQLLGDYTGALSDYTKAIAESESDYVLNYMRRGDLKYELEDYSGAIEDYTKIIQLFPERIDLYNKRAYAKYGIGDKKGACLDWSRAGELGDSSAYERIRKNCN